MIIGIGTDLVDIHEIRRYLDMNDAFETHTFTEAEREIGEKAVDKASYYAGLFACKEAVFKALGHHTEDQVWDFRCVETLHHSDGAPYVHPNNELRKYMKEAGVGSILVSITNENGFAQAFAVAQSETTE